MFSEQLAVMLLLAASQVQGPQASPSSGPVAQGARHALIRGVREPELVAALSLRARRMETHWRNAMASQTLLASAD